MRNFVPMFSAIGELLFRFVVEDLGWGRTYQSMSGNTAS